MSMKKLLNGLLLLTVLTVFSSALCAVRRASKPDPIVYSKLFVSVTAALDNSFAVTERINAIFNSQTHGVIHSIPFKTAGGQKAKITNIDVDGAEFRTFKDKSSCYLMIGDPEEFADDIEKYIINYKYALNKDSSKKRDVFCMNLIEKDWGASISRFSFKLQFPKKFSASKLRFTLNGKNITKSKSLFYTIEGNTISGFYRNIVPGGSVFTVELPLKEGYFSKAK